MFKDLMGMRDAIEDEATAIVKSVFLREGDDETTYCAVDTLGIEADFENSWVADVRCFVNGRKVYVGKVFVPTMAPSARMLGVYLAAYVIGLDDAHEELA